MPDLPDSLEEPQQIVVRGGASLEGTVEVSGAKNSVLKLMAATLLAEGTHYLHNVPRISDVNLMAELLCGLGCTVTKHNNGKSLAISVPAEINSVASSSITERFRASIAVLGPLLARNKEAVVGLPGGDDLGPRPIDIHLMGLSKLGAEVEVPNKHVRASAQRLKGTTIQLDFPSVGATENLLMAAVGASGTTTITNAALEPEIVDLCRFVEKMGVTLGGIGTPTLTVEGVSTAQMLDPATHSVVDDRIEAATFICAVGIAGGEATILGADAGHLSVLCAKLGSMGMDIDSFDGGLRVACAHRLNATDFATLPYPGVATDLKPLLVALLATANGVGFVTENLFAQRFRYIDELCSMGANIRVDSHHVVVEGVEALSPAEVVAPDIRAGAALVLAGLGAREGSGAKERLDAREGLGSTGETKVMGAHHIARGYDNFAGKLRALGANVRQENS